MSPQVGTVLAYKYDRCGKLKSLKITMEDDYEKVFGSCGGNFICRRWIVCGGNTGRLSCCIS
jgi:hypothetical protein